MCKRLFFFFLLLLSPMSLGAIIQGNPQGVVTLIEVYDYQCPHCRKMAPVVDELIEHNPSLKVRLMPAAVINKNSFWEAIIAIGATHFPGKFQAFHDMVMHSNGPLSKQQIVRIAQQLGLNTPAFMKIIKSKQTQGMLNDSLNMLHDNNANGVPLFVVSASGASTQASIFVGEQPITVLQQAIEKHEQERHDVNA